MGIFKNKDLEPDAPKFKLGPVKQVRYDEDGNVLGWAQDLLDEEGNPTGGTAFHSTELGRKERIRRSAEKAASTLNLSHSFFRRSDEESIDDVIEDIANF